MSDLVERLRNIAEPGWAGISNGLCYEAADEIERLRVERRTLPEYDDAISAISKENLRLEAEIERLEGLIVDYEYIGELERKNTKLQAVVDEKLPTCACGNRKQVPEVGGITVSEETENMQLMDGKSIPVRVTVYGCPECGFQWTDCTAEDARNEALIQHLYRRIAKLQAVVDAAKRVGRDMAYSAPEQVTHKVAQVWCAHLSEALTALEKGDE